MCNCKTKTQRLKARIAELERQLEPLREIARIANALHAPCCEQHEIEMVRRQAELMRPFTDDSFTAMKESEKLNANES